jgi:hypothetical protein
MSSEKKGAREHGQSGHQLVSLGVLVAEVSATLALAVTGRLSRLRTREISHVAALSWRSCCCHGVLAVAMAFLLLPWRSCCCHGVLAVAIKRLRISLYWRINGPTQLEVSV